MADDAFAPLERWLTQALAALEPAPRKALLREIGRELRKRNARRISRQTGPGGEPWRPRKRSTRGQVRSTAKMLQGLRDLRRLAVTAGAGGVEIGYSGRTARLAAVHHFGEVDTVAADGARVKYPARELLGFAPEDVAWVRERALGALTTPQ